MATAEQVALVRLLISDVDPSRQVLTDDDILTLLALEGEVVKLAAAQALDSIASSETLVGKVIRSQDLSTDGAKVAADLRAHAASLRAQVVAEGDDVGGFDVVGFGHRRPELTGH